MLLLFSLPMQPMLLPKPIKLVSELPALLDTALHYAVDAGRQLVWVHGMHVCIKRLHGLHGIAWAAATACLM